MANIPSYYPTPALQFLADRFENNRPYEWNVGGWATTMLKKVFSDDKWIIIPERSNELTRKRPDLVVQDMGTPYLLYEVKSSTGDRLEEALHQTASNLLAWADNYTDAAFYIIVQRGYRIAFFEYHNNTNDLDHHDVPHVWGCVSLTYPLLDKGTMKHPLATLPGDLLPIYHDYEKLKKETPIRTEAKKYTVKCVFDIRKHTQEINELFHYILTNEPREGPFAEDEYEDEEDMDEDEDDEDDEDMDED
jgi:Holliday junction resolvase